jgi:hypothetical protein
MNKGIWLSYPDNIPPDEPVLIKRKNFGGFCVAKFNKFHNCWDDHFNEYNIYPNSSIEYFLIIPDIVK